MSVIYEPKGRAGEYAGLACNVYETCPHGCTYCFVPGLPHVKAKGWGAEEFHRPAVARRGIAVGTFELIETEPRPGIVVQVRKELASKRLAGRRDDEVLLCFCCDAYPVEGEDVTREVLEAFAEVGQRVTVLTKRPVQAVARDWDLFLGNGWRLGVSMGCLDSAWIAGHEPGANSLEQRLEALEAAEKVGIDTWVSCEPSRPEWVLPVLACVYLRGVREVKVGRFNHTGEGFDRAGWARVCRELECDEKGVGRFGGEPSVMRVVVKGGTLVV